MEFLDNAVTKAKEVFDVACQKTGEVIGTSKQKIDIASMESKRSKDFEALGKLYFELVKEQEIENQSIKDIVDEIKAKNEKISNLQAELNAIKNKKLCDNCKCYVENDAQFCKNCGAKLD